jgi:hypothetical protein
MIRKVEFSVRNLLLLTLKERLIFARERARWVKRLAAGGVEIHELPVYPGGMLFEPFVAGLAEKLKTCLAEVERARS